MLENKSQDLLEQAQAAMTRGDYLGALRFGMRAADGSSGPNGIRCDAYLLLALVSLQMGMAEDALAFAVGAQLSACWAHDDEREEKAASMVAAVVAAQGTALELPEASGFH